MLDIHNILSHSLSLAVQHSLHEWAVRRSNRNNNVKRMVEEKKIITKQHTLFASVGLSTNVTTAPGRSFLNLKVRRIQKMYA